MLGALGVGASLLVACGGAQEKPAKPEAPPKPAISDLTISAREPTTITAAVFNPELVRPSLQFADVAKKKGATLEKVRVSLQKAKGEAKQAEAQALVTLIYQAIRSEKDAAKSQAMVEEARTALKDARTAAGDKVSLVTLRNLASLQLGANDYAGAGETYKETLTRFPTGDHVPLVKAFVAYTQLRQGMNADAAKTLEGVTPAPETPELSYVLAWSRWRGGDLPGALEAMTAAARGWKSNSSRPTVERDVSVLLARTGAPVEDAVKLLVDVTGNQRDQTYVALFRLHTAYAQSGRFGDAITILDRAAERVGDKIPVQDQASFLLKQADYSLRLGIHPEQVVAYQKKALAVLVKCADRCTAEEQNGGATVTRNLGLFFDTIYRTAHDERFYQPATEMYAAYLALPGHGEDKEVKDFVAQLDAIKKRGDAHDGTHDPSFMLTMVTIHNADVQSCYENVLIADASQSGALSLTLEVSDAGEVKGVTTDPAAGAAGLAKVAGCVVERAKTWAFPMRTQPGTSRVVMKYLLAAGPAAAAK